MPDRPAVVEGDRTWTYAALQRASRRLGGHLRRHGIGSGDLVAIHGRRSASLVSALLGVLEAGAGFVILDPAYPAWRRAECVRLARPRGWIALEGTGALAAVLEEALSGVAMRMAWPADVSDPVLDPAEAGEEPHAPAVDPDARAYVAFTSGSTGAPKGIVGTHRPLSHFLEWHVRRFDLGEDDRFCLLSGLAHDPLLRDVFTPLWLGATLYVPDEATVAEARLAEWLVHSGVTVAHLTPTLGQVLHAELSARDAGGAGAWPSLRYAFFGGEPLTRGDVARLGALAPASISVNYYGATETPQAMGYFVAERTDAGGDAERLPLGIGIEDVQLLVLGEGGARAGLGELGEIHVRTPYLAQGYLDTEAADACRFRPDPFLSPSVSRLYATGDLGRHRLDGTVEYAGRRDQQVKLRGFRIELAEVEVALRDHPGIAQAAAMLREDAGPPQLVAYVVAREGAAVDVADLSRSLAGRLPGFMVPSAFVVLDRLPLTPNGKVDRRGLPVPVPDAEARGEAAVPSRTAVEQVLAGMWAELLGREGVGLHDNFFDLGGHSLLATQLVSRVRIGFEVDLPLRALFQRPTVAGLAAALTERPGERVRIENNADAILQVLRLSDDEVERLLAGDAAEDAPGRTD